MRTSGEVARRSVDGRVPTAAPTARRRVVVVDDHRLFLESLAHVLGQQADLEVVGAVTSLTGLRACLVDCAPDVIVLDSQLPDGDAVEHLGELVSLAPGARIVVLTSRDNPRLARQALAHGAEAFLPKSTALGEVIAVLRGQAPRARSHHLGEPQAPHLTAREGEVLDLMARGLTNPAIADRLHLSTCTVRNHVAAVCAKTGTHSKLEAVTVARRWGLLA